MEGVEAPLPSESQQLLALIQEQRAMLFEQQQALANLRGQVDQQLHNQNILEQRSRAGTPTPVAQPSLSHFLTTQQEMIHTLQAIQSASKDSTRSKLDKILAKPITNSPRCCCLYGRPRATFTAPRAFPHFLPFSIFSYFSIFLYLFAIFPFPSELSFVFLSPRNCLENTHK